MTSVLTMPSHMTGFLHELGNSTGVYSYVSKPTTLVTNRPKFRNENIKGLSLSPNLMYNRRIVRGNTYSGLRTHILNINNKRDSASEGSFIRRRDPNNISFPKKDPDKRFLPNEFPGARLSNGFARARLSESGPLQSSGDGSRPTVTSSGGVPLGTRSIPPLPGRKHLELQTDHWLEEISDRIPETDAAVQTDPFVSPPPSPRHQVTSHGVDKETQIYPGDQDLFDFDSEVVTILEAIVGRTLEQSLLEVTEEEELAALRKQKLAHIECMKTLEI